MKPNRHFLSLVTFLLGVSLLSSLALAAPTEITRCQVIRDPGSYVLANNLTKRTFNADTSCIRIKANHVTLDLGGFTIKGNGTGGTAINKDARIRTGITIRNGRIVGFVNGINFSGSARSVTIESVEFSNNVSIGAEVQEMANVRNCHFFGNGQGLRVGANSTVTDNRSESNQTTGIQAGIGSLVNGNVANLNGGNGFVIAVGSTIINNTSRNNQGTGISVACPSNVIGNTATANTTNLSLSNATCNNSNNVAP